MPSAPANSALVADGTTGVEVAIALWDAADASVPTPITEPVVELFSTTEELCVTVVALLTRFVMSIDLFTNGINCGGARREVW